MIQKKQGIRLAWAIGAALLGFVTGGCSDTPTRSNPVDPVIQSHQLFLKGRSDEMRPLFDYRGLLSHQLGDIWTTAGPNDQTAAVEQLHTMMLSTTRHLWTYLEPNEALALRVHRVSDAEAWVLANPKRNTSSHRNEKKFEWRYRVLMKNGVWTIRQREYTVGNQRSNTLRFYPTIIRHLQQEYGRTPSLSELVANLPSLQRRTRVRRYTIPAKPTRKTKSAPK